ncbi:Glutathione-regulated potassium-efflux system protein KefC [Marinomonas aquimarina]|uniref:Glutathione-regulated potassium-efflux system protein KefC n=1 Tax=Marinomonas aquimarina TaxID=295068 RepID=A0A1A8TH87_9GAMM|nr:cation:proton antiporter [Marinomonas aquimarina]SBS31412.1 Glutathione-regulated potassium-efflux system protein KefC [Marinomonas aquimarina]
MTDLLLIAFVFLMASVIAVPLASKFSLGSVLGYLLAGITIAPLLTLLNVDVKAVQHVAEFGVVMMLFLVGLELDPKELWRMKGRLLGLGGGQVLLTTALIAAIASQFNLPWQTAITVGLVFSLSSTAIVLQTLNEKGLLKSDGGQASFSVLLSQDIAVIPMLIILPMLAIPELAQSAQSAQSAQNGAGQGHSEFSLIAGLNDWQTALVTISAIIAVIFIGSVLSSPIFKFVAMARLRELFTASALLFVVGIALLMSLVNLSPALGTFIAGVVLANSVFKHELESNIEPIKGLLLGLFFMTVGASINFRLLADQFLIITGLTIALVLIKASVLWGLAKAFKVEGSDRWLLALGLAQAGEFGFVLLSFTVSNGILSNEMADNLLLVVAMSMLISPGLFIIHQRFFLQAFYNKQEHNAPKQAIPNEGKIIIAGSGRVGGMVDLMLRTAGYETTVVDYSIERLKELESFKINTYFGDATQPNLLEAAGIKDTKLLVVALDEAPQITKLVRHVLKLYPNVHIIARAVDRHHVYDLWAEGCRDIISETYDSSLRMGRSAFEALGVTADAAEQMKDLFQQDDREAMRQAASAYKVGVPAHENEEYIKSVLELFESKHPETKAKLIAIRDQNQK